MLNFVLFARGIGDEEPDKWIDGTLHIAARTLEPMTVRLAVRDEMLIAEVPFGDDVAVLWADPTISASLGRGIAIELRLPELTEPATLERAAALNEREIETRCQAHPLGTWTAEDDIYIYRTILPNVAHVNQEIGRAHV